MRIAIIGSGFGGIAAAIELKKRGYDDIVLLEKADDVGGVWRDNTYPGAACDVPSPFYSYSFELNPNWPHRYSRQPAILDYIRDVAKKYDVLRHVRFGTEVAGADFSAATGRWTVHLAGGEDLEADVVVPAVGQLSRPSIPDLPGLDTFQGESFHSARWDHDISLEGKRVAVIGTGASAIQFVPAIQPEVGHLTVFQRTPAYLLPRLDQQFTGVHAKVFSMLPATQLVERYSWASVVESLSLAFVYAKPLAAFYKAWSRRHMQKLTASEPGLFEKVWPTYPIGCKRVLFSDNYLPALAQPNVSLVTDGVTEITPTGVRTSDGVEHEVDVIIWGTGFAAADFLAPMTFRGLGGRLLEDEWEKGAHAYYGLSVPDFPNLQIMYGPNTNTGGGSVIYFLEIQARYLADFVDRVAKGGKALQVRREVEQAYDDVLQDHLRSSVWTQCSSWYRNSLGRITTNWPTLPTQYRLQARFRADDYVEVS